jgi:steroid delta-isomerase-like uncharacterized protein
MGLAEPDPQRNKAIALRFYAEFWNRGNEAAADELIAKELIHEQFPAGWPTGRQGFKRLVQRWRAAFPDMAERVGPIVAEGQWVASRFVLTGTHRGEFYGIPATMRSIEISGIDLLRIDGGLIAEWIYHEDTLSIFRQLGHTPADWDTVAS